MVAAARPIIIYAAEHTLNLVFFFSSSFFFLCFEMILVFLNADVT